MSGLGCERFHRYRDSSPRKLEQHLTLKHSFPDAAATAAAPACENYVKLDRLDGTKPAGIRPALAGKVEKGKTLSGRGDRRRREPSA